MRIQFTGNSVPHCGVRFFQCLLKLNYALIPVIDPFKLAIVICDELLIHFSSATGGERWNASLLIFPGLCLVGDVLDTPGSILLFS